MKIELKKTGENDLREVAGIYAEEFSKPPFGEPWTVDKAVDKFRIFMKYCDIWTIFCDGEIAGVIVVNPSQWYPGSVLFGEEMAIRADLQRKGIGQEVFRQIFEMYKEKGYTTYMGMVKRTSKSYGFHKKMGLQESDGDVLMEGNL